MKSFSTFALPTETKGLKKQKESSGGCHSDTEKRLKREETREDENDFSELKPEDI